LLYFQDILGDLEEKENTANMTIKVGDSIPSIEGLQESKPGNAIDIAKEIGSGDAVIVGVPAAFSKFMYCFLVVIKLGGGKVRLGGEEKEEEAKDDGEMELERRCANLIQRPNLFRLPYPRLHQPPQG
jgi:hypothetical protein